MALNHHASDRKKRGRPLQKAGRGSGDSLKSARRQMWIGIALAVLTIVAVIILLIALTSEPSNPQPAAPVTPTATPVSRVLKLTDKAQTPARASKIVIRSDMDGTEIWINGRFKGITPLVIRNPDPGTYKGKAVIKNPRMERRFEIKVDPDHPRTITKDITFKGGSPIPAIRPTRPQRKPQRKIQVDYPQSVQFKKFYSIIVRPIPGVKITNGMVYILPKCLADKVDMKDAPSFQMFPYRGGLIRENLKPEWCRGPGRDKKNGAYFYIKLMTSAGPMNAGSPEHPFEIEFKR